MKKTDNILLKVCGLKHPDNILEVVKLAPDFVGFIFYPKSPRYIVGTLDGRDLKKIPSRIKKVGVFVDEDVTKVNALALEYGLDMLQLHGSESPAYCKQCKERYPVIKAFAMAADFDFKIIDAYKETVDYFLFDTKSEKHGGSGKQFDWSLLKNYKMDIPYFLSGGIGPEDIESVLRAPIPPNFILDINSKVELQPGLKDTGKIKTVKERLNNAKISSIDRAV